MWASENFSKTFPISVHVQYSTTLGFGEIEESLKVSDAYILFDILCMYNNNKTALFEISSEFCKYKVCVPKRL